MFTNLILLSFVTTCYGYGRKQVADTMPIGTLYRWKQIDFEYPTPQDRQKAIINGDFIQENVKTLGVERWKDRVFVSTPRWKRGIPATLSALPIGAQSESPPLAPFPSWDWHNAGNCSGFTSIFPMSVDHCGVMWVLDSGQVEAFETPRQLCPPTLFAINLDTDTVIASYPIPSEYVLQNSIITNLVVDSRDAHCRDLHVYQHYYIKVLKPKDNANTARITLRLAILGEATSQSIPTDNDTPPFSTLYKWKHVDFEFPSPRHRKNALSTGKYVPENVLPLGLEVWGSRVWVTLPSWRHGVPATLATLPRAGGIASPPLKPYPDWSYHSAFSDNKNCSGLTSVFRVNADPCGRLWVLDSGQIDSQDTPKQICPPSIVVFDLHTDKLIARYQIPSKYVLQNSLYSNIIVDTRTADCSDLHAYIADTWRFGLLVFRERDESFWRFSHPLFYPDPLASNFTLHGLNFQWADGIFGLALTPIQYFVDRVLFFHSLSSYREFYVSTSVLREPSRANDSASEFNLLGESRGLFGQSSASVIDKRGVMFYGLVSRDSIGCWDTRKPYTKKTNGVVAFNSETLIYPNDIKIDQQEQQSVWVISNKLPIFQAGPLDPDDYNYRIMYADTVEAVQGTVCDPMMNSPAPTTLVQRG